MHCVSRKKWYSFELCSEMVEMYAKGLDFCVTIHQTKSINYLLTKLIKKKKLLFKNRMQLANVVF